MNIKRSRILTALGLALLAGAVVAPQEAASQTAADTSATNANWDIFPDITLQAGHLYHIVDSDPATWSCNEDSADIGFVELFTDEGAETEGEFTPCTGH